jgi:hypothetical protein
VSTKEFLYPFSGYTRGRAPLWAALFAFPILLSAQTDPNAVPAADTSASFPSHKQVERPVGPLGLKWVSIGFRVPVSLHPEVANENFSSGTTLPTTTYTTTNETMRTNVGLAMEFPVYRHLSLMTEGYVHHLKYMSVHELNQVDPNSTGEILTTWTENTKATEWDVPVMLRYSGLRSGWLLSKMYAAGGESYRRVNHVHTTTDYLHQVPSATAGSSSSSAPVPLGHSAMNGAVVAVGLRLIDDFNIRVTPEVRYTRWEGHVLSGAYTVSRRDQLDVGVALTF